MYRIRTASICKSQLESEQARRVREYFGAVDTVDEPPLVSDYAEGKTILHISEKRGQALNPCASMNEEYVCCGVHVLKSVSNCPFDCSYCVLQDYLTNAAIQVVADTQGMIAEIRSRTAREPWRFFRIGTWVLGDSLAFEPLTRSASELVLEFSKLRNCVLELKTKSNHVDSLLDLPHGGRTVLAWSLNPEHVIATEEHRTANLDRRLAALRKSVQAGYPVALHFDPMLVFAGWEDAYENLVHDVFAAVPSERIAWISIGSLRFNPEMKKGIELRFPDSPITAAEMVLGGDGKLRYVKPLRVALYSHLYRAIRKYGGSDPFVYLCMERRDVWKKVLGLELKNIGHHDFEITASLDRRFPGLVHQKPEMQLYESLQY